MFPGLDDQAAEYERRRKEILGEAPPRDLRRSLSPPVHRSDPSRRSPPPRDNLYRGSEVRRYVEEHPRGPVQVFDYTRSPSTTGDVSDRVPPIHRYPDINVTDHR